jgi:branched-chain amino acid aminotransferase
VASTEQKVVWFDGKLVPLEQATVNVGAHALHFGSSVFEGIRAYELQDKSAIFRLEEHLDRLWDSCKIYRMEIPYSRDEFRQAILDTIRANGHKSCYIRPLVFYGAGGLGVTAAACPIHTAVIVIQMGKYLGPEALEKGVDVGVSSWQRMAPNTFAAAAKIGGNYINSQFIFAEAQRHGYTEGIALDVSGYVSEGSGENIFVLRRGELITPPQAGSILDGITRRSVITLAREMGLEVRQEFLPRELLYVAEEIFFCGTAAEITPIRSVDGIVVGDGRRGPVTTKLMRAFFDIVEGVVPDRHGWLTLVPGM